MATRTATWFLLSLLPLLHPLSGCGTATSSEPGIGVTGDSFSATSDTTDTTGGGSCAAAETQFTCLQLTGDEGQACIWATHYPIDASQCELGPEVGRCHDSVYQGDGCEVGLGCGEDRFFANEAGTELMLWPGCGNEPLPGWKLCGSAGGDFPTETCACVCDPGATTGTDTDTSTGTSTGTGP